MNYYGDSQRWFVATVTNARDPQGVGRVQIRIHGIHSPDINDIPEHALPWAECAMPTTEGGTSGLSKLPQIMESAMVYGIFLDGKTSQAPFILGVFNKKETPSLLQQNSDQYSNDRNKVKGGDEAWVPPEIGIQFANDSTVDQRRLIIMMYFVTKGGYTPQQAAGITGNLEGECSSFEPSFEGPNACKGGAGERGLCQWNPGKKAGKRLDKLKQFAAQGTPPRNPEDFYTQLDFVLHELSGPRSRAGGSDFAGCEAKLRKCTSFLGGQVLTNSTWVFLSKYEIPKDMPSELRRRTPFAIKAMDAYNRALANVKSLKV